jgi:hypothetical protein
MMKDELQLFKDLREIDIAIKQLETHAASVSKRFKRGIRMLLKEKLNVEKEIDSKSVTSENATRSRALRRLIADPQLKHIPEDTNV